MKKTWAFLGLLLIAFTAYAAIDWEIPNNVMKMGDGTNATAKSFEMKMGLGASNPILSSTDGTEMTVNIPFRAQGSITANGDGNFDGSVTLGDGTAVDRTVLVDRGGSNPFLRWDESAGAWIFSNDGTLEKKIGSGSGGGAGGINFLANPSFEDPGSPILNWTSFGGTFTQEDHINGREDNLKFARFVATSASQYFESDSILISDDVNGGCMADFKYNQGDNAFEYKVLKSPFNDPADVVASAVVSDLVNFAKVPTIVFPCEGGDQFRLRITSTGSGTIDVDEAYLGSNKGFVAGTFQNSFTETGNGGEVVGAGVLMPFGSANSKGWDGDEYTVQRPNSVIKITAGSIFTAATTRSHDLYLNGAIYKRISQPVSNDAHTMDFISSAGEFAQGDILSIRLAQGSGTLLNNPAYHYININETSNAAQEAFTPEQAEFFLDVNIGGADSPGLSTGGPKEITSPSWDLVQDKGSAFIACSGTEESSGLTCSGDESLGYATNVPVDGRYKICTSFQLIKGPQDSGSQNGNPTFRLVETENDSQVVLQTGTSAAMEQRSSSGVVGGLQSAINSVRLCSDFNLTKGKKTFRIFYQGTIFTTSMIIKADRAASVYSPDVNFTMELKSNFAARPIIQNMVDTKLSSGLRVESCEMTNTGSAYTFNTSEACNAWISAATRISTGRLDLDIQPGVFAERPACTCLSGETGGGNRGCGGAFTGDWTATHLEYSQWSSGGALVDDQILSIICVGRRQ